MNQHNNTILKRKVAVPRRNSCQRLVWRWRLSYRMKQEAKKEEAQRQIEVKEELRKLRTRNLLLGKSKGNPLVQANTDALIDLIAKDLGLEFTEVNVQIRRQVLNSLADFN